MSLHRALTSWLRISCLLIISCRLSASEKVLGVETDEFDFDGLPGAQHEFKIEIGAGREECFYQPIVKGGKLHVSFEVLYGGDISVYLRDATAPHDVPNIDAHVNVRDGVLLTSVENADALFETFCQPLLCAFYDTYITLLHTGVACAEHFGVFGVFKVLKGGDQLLDYYIRKPSLITPVQEACTRPRWIAEVDCDEEGAYAICLDNTASRMASKLVYVYLVTYVEEEWSQYRQEIEELQLTVTNFSAYAICLDNTASRMASKLVYVYLVTYVEEEWSQYRQEIEELQLTVTNFSETIKNVQQSITDSLVHQASSRMNVIRDWYLITGNNTHVQRMSIAMCLVIVVSSCVQVYFVRRLFRYTSVTPTQKPRA